MYYRDRESQRKRVALHPLGHPQDDFNGQGQSQETGASYGSCLWVADAQTLQPSSVSFLKPLAVAEVEQMGQKLVPEQDANMAGRGFTSYTNTLVPQPNFQPFHVLT